MPTDQLQVLVIDEGELSRSVLGRLLRELGVRHLQMARRPEEARRLIKNAPQPYDLIISDMAQLPGSGTGAGAPHWTVWPSVARPLPAVKP